MIAVSVCQSVCLSRGSTRLHCAKMAEQIKILFMVNTPGGPSNIVLDGGPDTTSARRGGFDAAFAKLLWPLVLSDRQAHMHYVWGGRVILYVLLSVGRDVSKLHRC